MSTSEEKDAEIAQLKADLEAAQRRLDQMEDIAKVGELAATMAHEIRNPLAGISSLAEVLRSKINATGSTAEIIDTILEEVDRLNRIVKDLLRFARPGKAVMVPTDLLTVLNQVLAFLEERLAEGNFRINKHFTPACPIVMADVEQMRQVFLNIMLNAMDAIKDPKNPRSKEGVLDLRVSQPSEKTVEIAFTDNGLGIPPANLEKIFDPFFTTKAQGTGLGLAASRKIIDHHGGKISAKSEVGKGTTFTIQIPVA
jgi:two-component system NtrC family sensor kinase